MLLIGSHVSFANKQMLGSVEEAVSYGANTFMFYTGAPQNTVRNPLNDNFTKEAKKLMKDNNIDINNVVCHAAYIINLANNKELEKYKFSIEFLKDEIKRCHTLGITKLVIHPGSAVGIDRSEALKNIIYAINIILEDDEDVVILLETMAGKGTELGINIDEIETIINGVNKKDLIGLCLDTCHLNDSGVDIAKFSEYLDDLDKRIGLDKVKVIHVNDSKNEIGSHKDRHEIIGYGTIGFDNIINAIYDERLVSIPKILETPYIGDDDNDKMRIYPPYKFEIEMLRSKNFNQNLKEDIRNYYKKSI